MKGLHYLNLVGVLLLATLCVLQWQANRRLNLEVNQLEASRLALESRVHDLERASAGLEADRDHFRHRFTEVQTEAQAGKRGRVEAESRLRQLERERDHLRERVDEWTHAVSVRDERLMEAVERLEAQSEQLRESIVRYNELAERHNLLVQDWNEAQSRLAPAPPR